MQQPLISVIVPCYNQSIYMDECLQSVLDQTYQNWECIIVNDGSPDNTEEVALHWVEKDTRFIYLKKENGGLSSARNAGIEKAKGEWILPLDSDDKIANQYLELASQQFNNGYTIIYCEAEFFGDKEGKWELPVYEYNQILINNLIFCSGIYKRQDWIAVEGYDINLKYGREDWDLWLAILNINSKVIRINYTGFYYRRKENSMDIELNLDINKRTYSENYIYKKHLCKYLRYNDNAIFNYIFINNKLDQLKKTNHQINKNIITRLLFKLIKLIS
ncbi:MAG TPA: glycosyl transferase family 2 [Flavobacteriaceae bacterium]|nr:glycosyl transferase family 2 [Flavobacteriaceae bacterium]